MAFVLILILATVSDHHSVTVIPFADQVACIRALEGINESARAVGNTRIKVAAAICAPTSSTNSGHILPR